MGMQKVFSNTTYMKCLTLAKAAMAEPEGIFIQCPTKADAIRYRALFFSLRKKLGYKEGQIPAMAIGLFTVEFRISENPDSTYTLNLRRAGAQLDNLEVLTKGGRELQLENISSSDHRKEKTDYLIQLERIKYFIQLACPSYAHESNAPSIYLTAEYLYKSGTRLLGDLPATEALETAYKEDFVLAEAKVLAIGEMLEEGELLPPEAWNTGKPSTKPSAPARKRERAAFTDLSSVNFLEDEDF